VATTIKRDSRVEGRKKREAKETVLEKPRWTYDGSGRVSDKICRIFSSHILDQVCLPAKVRWEVGIRLDKGRFYCRCRTFPAERCRLFLAAC
jgi:hypothetical protein